MRQFITDSNLDKIYVAGGEFIYHEFLEDCDEIVMTMVDIEYPENEQNKYFPLGTLSMRFTMLGESNWIESKTGINYKFINYMQKVNDRFIDIIVCGNSSSGKSTIINEIYRFLWTRGFSVELNLEGNSDYRDEAVFRRQMNDGNEEQRLAAIKTTKIKLKEVPAVTSFRDEKK
jgi:ABC-type multidrug transport system fused ATPase/permease subunit